MITALFWLILAAMTFGVIATLIVPILRHRPAGWRRGDFSRQVYRDQLRELDVDVERGVITGDEADAARLEIQRRLITTEDKTPDDIDDDTDDDIPARGAARRAAAASIAILVPVAGLSLYMSLGSPGAPNAPPGKPHPPLTGNAGPAAAPARPAAQSNGEMAPHELDENIAKLRARLEKNPADLQGWLLLGRSLTVTDRHSESVAVFQKAIELDPTNVDHKTMAAESMVLATGGRVTADAEAMFSQVLAARPSDPAARYYIALSRAQADKFREAFDMWRSLLLDAPPDAAWRAAVAQRVGDMAERLGIDVATVAPQALTGAPARPVRPQQPAVETDADDGSRRGPSQADMAAAAKMSPAERQQMIRGMVEGLADRLKEEPNDPKGWQRLVRVYGVLGEKEKAYATMDRAAANVPDDVGALLNFAGALMRARGAGDPAPKAAIASFERVLKINPQNPGALFFIGQVQAESGQIDQARATWQRLLQSLDPASPSYATVNGALEKLNSAN